MVDIPFTGGKLKMIKWSMALYQRHLFPAEDGWSLWMGKLICQSSLLVLLERLFWVIFNIQFETGILFTELLVFG